MLRKLAVLIPLLGLANAAVYTVTVGIDETDGQPGLGFDPSSIRPTVGDTITFTFSLPDYIKNPISTQHSATQSSFDAPCTPLVGGFDTGILSTGSVNSNTGASFSVTVNNTDPLWFFSSANQDCKAGMVLSVNPPLSGDQTAAAFKAKAMASSGTQPSAPPSSSQTSTSLGPTITVSGSSSAPAPTGTNNSGAASLSSQTGLTLVVIAVLMGTML